jgi:CUE domain
MSGADALVSMFPGRDRRTLQAALDAHGGSVERAVESLLSAGPGGGTMPGAGVPSIVYDSGNPIADRERARQLEQDEIMARALAFEEERAAQESPMGVARGLAGSVANNAPAMPTLDSVGAFVAPVISGLQYAGKVAVDTVSGLYEELVHGSGAGSASEPTSPELAAAARRRAAERDAGGDGTHVVHGDASSPARAGLQARARRTAVGGSDGHSSEKKRE